MGSGLSVESIEKRFGGVEALKGVSFHVRAGSVLGIIGPNGCGKTTLINAITGFVRADAGSVRLGTHEITRRSPSEVVRLGIARTFQTARPFRRLSAVESLIVPLRASKQRWGERRALALDLLEEVGFERDSSVPHQPAASLPQGYLRRLELARCLALEPRVIMTDELFSGLSPSEVMSLMPLLEKLKSDGMTMVLVEHRLPELFQLADSILVIDEGEVLVTGTPAEVIRDPRVREVYLGAET